MTHSVSSHFLTSSTRRWASLRLFAMSLDWTTRYNGELLRTENNPVALANAVRVTLHRALAKLAVLEDRLRGG